MCISIITHCNNRLDYCSESRVLMLLKFRKSKFPAELKLRTDLEVNHLDQQSRQRTLKLFGFHRHSMRDTGGDSASHKQDSTASVWV